MSTNMMKTPDTADPGSSVEQLLIDEYLRSRGQSRATLRLLPAGEREKHLRAACDYASLRLLEIHEAR